MVAPLRLVPRSPHVAGARLARRGARAFAVRGGGDEVLVTLPGVVGPVCVLVPRGHGWPLLARRAAGALRAVPTGEPCAPARWDVAGGLAARVRPVEPPRGPVMAELGPEPRQGEGWVCVRPSDLAWSALRREDPSAGHGPVVLADRWVRAASPEAQARGVSRGMSLALARRKCPNLQVRPAVSGVRLGLEIGAWLGGELGEARRVPGGWLVRWAVEGRESSEVLAEMAGLARRIGQRFGVRVRAAAAVTEAAARGLVSALEQGHVAAAEPQATRQWEARAPRVSTWAASARRAGWEGRPWADVEGAVELVRALAGEVARAADGRTVRVVLDGEKARERIDLSVPPGLGRAGLGSLVEAHLRRPLVVTGALRGVRVLVRAGAFTHGGAAGLRAAAQGAR